jgi:hypothetical protein
MGAFKKEAMDCLERAVDGDHAKAAKVVQEIDRKQCSSSNPPNSRRARLGFKNPLHRSALG